jgi:hypothetical protein
MSMPSGRARIGRFGQPQQRFNFSLQLLLQL